MTLLAYSRTYPLDRRFTIEFSLIDGQLQCAWAPDIPHGREARSLLPAYRKARTDFLRSLDLNFLVVEI